MKNIFLLPLIIITCAHSLMHAQVSGTAPVGDLGLINNAQGGSPMLNLVLMDLRMKRGTPTNDLETLGSPYYTDNFVKSKVYYDDEFIGDYYIRYNALISEIELKNSNLPEEEVSRLLADKRIKIRYQNRVLEFTTFITKKNQTRNGYLTKLLDGAKYDLYHRLAVKYSEGKKAPNSMVNDIPNRFAHFEEYYFKKDGINRIDQLSLKKGKFMKLIDKELREEVKHYLEENKLNLNKEADLITAFEYINTL